MKTQSTIADLKAAGLKAAKAAANGSSKLAKALNCKITPQAISQWRQIPADRVLDVERATGVSRHLLRPDLYPEDVAPRSRRKARG